MLYEYLKKRMLQHPNQIISNDKERITYSELLEYAEYFGEKLTKNKYGLLFDSDFDTAKALLACLYANKTAVPLSKRYGKTHVRGIIDAVKLSYLITEDGVQKISGEPNEPEDLSDVALIMCTSGTTGKPKGAMITYSNLLTNLTDILQYFEIDCFDHILIARPIYHCAVLTGEFLASLSKGLRITFMSEGFVPDKILQKAKQVGVTTLCGTPTLMYYLSKINLRVKNPLKLKSIVISGECITRPVAQVIRRAFPDANIYSVYGLTEASPRVSYLTPKEFDDYPTSVGLPLSSLKAKIVDNELLVSGKSIMRGYYNNPETTSGVKKDGWLCTGDIAEIDEQGRIYIKGRKDNMIIRAGMNIYPQEIESVLKDNKSIIDVLAYGVRGDTVGERIAIKVVTKLSKKEVYDICKQKLPGYKLPDVISIVDSLPRNASGKVIRNAKRN